MNRLEVNIEYNKLDKLFLVTAKDSDLKLDFDDPYRSWGIEKNNYGVVYETNRSCDAYAVKRLLEKGELEVKDLI